ncbi:hypothetical protein ES703_49803 [subsurface metagenome]
MYNEAGGIGNTVADGKELHIECPQRYLFAGRYHFEFGVGQRFPLLEFDPYHATGQAGSVDRDIKLR